jgi:hypothetical protein
MPLNFTDVAPPRFVPVIVMLVPTGPAVGVNDVIEGVAYVTVKLEVDVALPAALVTFIGPEVAPAGTVTLM